MSNTTEEYPCFETSAEALVYIYKKYGEDILLGIGASKASKKKQDETRREQYAATHKRIAFICPGCGTRYIRTADLNAEIYQHCCPKCKRWWTIHKFSWQEL